LEKVVKMVQTNPNHAVGDSLTLADLYLMTLFLCPEMDPIFTEGYGGMEDDAPTCAAIYANVVKNPVVAKFIQELKDAKTPYTGMGILY